MIYPLLTKRLGIAPLGTKDLAEFVRYRQDPEIARFQSWDTNYPEATAGELIESQSGVLLPETGQWLQLAIHNQVTSELIGDLALHSLDRANGVFEIGFTISRNHQRHGFAKEAAERLVEFLFETQAAVKIVAHTDSRNLASIATLGALGFKQDPTKSWDEEFKEEPTTVYYFELISPAS